MNRLKKLLPGVGCVLLVAGAVVAPAGRWAHADPPSCEVINGETYCTVPPIVATGTPPVPRPFENQTAPQAPGPDPDPNGYCQPGADWWPQCGRP